MVNINLEAVNLAKWKQAGLEIEKALNGRGLMIDTSRVLEKRFKLLSKIAFNSQGSTTGKKWNRLSEPYATFKAKRYPGKTILRRKDALYKSYTKKPISLFFKSGGGYIYKYGSKDKRARWHQAGTDTMPARKVIEYTPQQLMGISASIRRTTFEVIKKRKFFDRVPSLTAAIRNGGFDRVNTP